MVIKRRDTKTGQPVHRQLGHVAVCVEDLQALIDLLAAHPDVTNDVIVEFDEGHFTEGRDLKELGDSSLRYLRVSAGDLLVILESRNAQAIGPRTLVEFVDNAWARSRQTSEYPASWGRGDRYSYKLSSTITGLLIAAGLVTYVVSQWNKLSPQLLVFSTIFFLVTGGFMTWLMYSSNKEAFNNTSWAVIRPLTTHELRELQSRRTVVPLWSLIIAIAGFVVSTIFLIIEQIQK